MKFQHILSKVDHTLLTPAARWEDIKNLCNEGLEYKVASICIPPAFVKIAKSYLGNELQVCTVIGFPNGYNTTETKVFEAHNAIEKGADEIDMVINLGKVKEGDFEFIESEIRALKEVTGEKILKVIVETCLLDYYEKIELCKVVTNAGADFIKTSTGFSTCGATREDIRLFAQNIGPNVRIKAAGGIRSLQDAIDFIELGASRLGTSSIIKLLRNNETEIY